MCDTEKKKKQPRTRKEWVNVRHRTQWFHSWLFCCCVLLVENQERRGGTLGNHVTASRFRNMDSLSSWRLAFVLVEHLFFDGIELVAVDMAITACWGGMDWAFTFLESWWWDFGGVPFFGHPPITLSHGDFFSLPDSTTTTLMAEGIPFKVTIALTRKWVITRSSVHVCIGIWRKWLLHGSCVSELSLVGLYSSIAWIHVFFFLFGV